MGRSGNRVFRMRHFTLNDDRCAMKVGSDGLLLGAWAGTQPVQRILDIGTGSGLVALMMAQRFPEATVTAIELEPEAASQARENFAASPFSERLHLEEGDFLLWAAEVPTLFDWAVCNPPFFRNKPKSPDPARNLARHDDSLPIEKLLRFSHHLTVPSGRMSLVWPTDRSQELLHAAQSIGWYPHRILSVHGTPEHPCERQVVELEKSPTDCLSHTRIDVEMNPFEPGKTPERSEAFKSLMAPFIERYADELSIKPPKPV